MNKVRLRALELKDLDFLFEIENDWNLWYLSHTQQPFSRKLLKQYIRDSDRDIYEARQLRLAIETTDNNFLIGFVDLFNFDPKNRRAGVGIVIHKEFQNKTFGTDTLLLLTQYAFNVLFLHQLYANISVDNTPSIHLFEKIGFKRIGIKKDWNFDGKKYKDEVMYQLINT